MTSNEKKSKSLKKNWSKLDIKQRQARMKPLNDARWKGTTKKERKAHASMAAQARWKKWREDQAKKKTKKK